jgi:alkanesulfonate monooxygenase SsuD/methylene tetrahydromethanopterin reductase-like flavin-dependent oxidoreductase (luciferase family)
VKLGLALPHYDTSYAGEPASWERVKQTAQTAEASGFSSVWVSDHLFLDWGKYGGPSAAQGSLECWATMAGLAASTSDIRIGSLTLCNDFRNPALVAKMAATLDLLSGGRLDVGLGAGWYEPEYRAAGIDFDRPRVRIERLSEAAEIIGRLLEGEEVTFKGEHYVLDGAICRPGPRQVPRPPIWIGGKGDRLLSVVARIADGWNFSWLGSFDVYEERCAYADSACECIDRDPSGLRRSVGAYLLVGTDDADAKRRFERLASVTPPGLLGGSSGTGVSWEEFRSGDRIAGTVQQAIDRLGRLKDMGVEEVIVSLGAVPFQVGDLEDVEFVGTEIASALK